MRVYSDFNTIDNNWSATVSEVIYDKYTLLTKSRYLP